MSEMSSAALTFGLIYLVIGFVVFVAVISMAIDAARLLRRASRLAELTGTTNRLLLAQAVELRAGFAAQEKVLGLLLDELRAMRAPGVLAPVAGEPGIFIREEFKPVTGQPGVFRHQSQS